MNQPQLTPRDGNNPPKRENMTPEQKRVMDEIDKLTKSESAALAVLAQAQAATQVATEGCEMKLQALMDMMVKCMLHFGVPLPKAIVEDMASGDYSPDELPTDGLEDEEDDDEDEEDIKP